MNSRLSFIAALLLPLTGLSATVITETTGASGIKHPGCLQSAAEINALATALGQNDPVRTSYWNSMISNGRGKYNNSDWIPPTDLFGSDFAGPAKYAGAGLIRYINDWIINGNTSSEAHAIYMLNTWAGVQSWTADPNDGYQHHRLQSMWFGYLAHAADLLISSGTSWPVSEQEAFKNTVQTIFLPIANNNRAAGFNGNWDAGATWAVMCMAILLDDKPLFDAQIAWLKAGATNASFPHYLLASGQCQESARDQGHANMGLTFLSLCAQTAWTQGIDLYEYDNRSLGRAFEYNAAYNQGEDDLPFQVYPSPIGSNSAHDTNAVISADGRPTYFSVYEMVYHHYKNYRGIELPHCKAMLENHTRQEQPGPNWSNHNTALYWNLDLSTDAALRNAQGADVSLDINSNYADRASLRLNCGGDHYGATDGRAFTKEKSQWHGSGGSNVSHSNPIAGTGEEALYQSYRQGGTSGSFYYNFGLPNGLYRVRLHFAEPTYTQANQRKFNVYLEGTKALDQFDIYAVAGNKTAYIHNTLVTLNDGLLDVQLESLTDRAIINAIEVVPYFEPQAIAGSETVEEDASVAITLAGSDADGDTLGYTVTQQPAHGTLSGTVPNLTYTPNADYNGSDSFQFTVNDGDNTSTPATVDITVSPVNDVPVATADSISVNQNNSAAITLTGSDVDNDPLSFAVDTQPTNGTLSGTAPNLIYTPDTGYNGPDSFTFTASDGASTSSTATVSITVHIANVAPVANADSVTVDEDGSVAITLTGSDADGQDLTYHVVDQPTNGTLSGTAPNLIYTPDPNYNGTDSFTFKVNDSIDDSAAVSVSVTVEPVNDAPTFTSDPLAGFAAEAGAASSGSLSGWASDVDGDPLTYAKAGGPAWLTVAPDGSLGGTPQQTNAGTNIWQVLVSDGNGGAATASLQITVSQQTGSVGLPFTESAFIRSETYADTPQGWSDTLDIKNGNNQYNRIAMLKADLSSFSGTVDSASFEVSDVDTVAHTLYIYGVVDSAGFQDWTGGAAGTATWNAVLNNGMFTPQKNLYSIGDPNLVLLGSQSLTGSGGGDVRISVSGSALVDLLNNDTDGLLTFVVATSTDLLGIGIRPHTHANGPTLVVSGSQVPDNQAPTAAPAVVAVDMDSAAAITLAGSDPDGDGLDYTVTAAPTNGVLSGTAPNLTYTPTAGVHGSDRFSFLVNDGKVDSPEADVLITIVDTTDSDGDGLTDVQEIALGTDPNDPNSGLGIGGTPFPMTGKIEITWPSASGVLYRVWESPNLTDWTVARDWTNATAIPEDTLELNLTPSNGFFKVEAEIQ